MSDDRQRLPIFPLPTVVLFPKLRVPLHIFEPRYRQMTQFVLDGDQRIGLVAILPGQEASGDPPVYPIGCAGIVRDSQQLPDGRYNIVVEGTARFRIVEEIARTDVRLYRIADVELLGERESSNVSALRLQVTKQIDGIARRLGKADGVAVDAFDEVDDETFTNALANGFNFFGSAGSVDSLDSLEFAASEKQGLLEANGVRERLERLSHLFEFALAELQAGRTPNSGALH